MINQPGSQLCDVGVAKPHQMELDSYPAVVPFSGLVGTAISRHRGSTGFYLVYSHIEDCWLVEPLQKDCASLV